MTSTAPSDYLTTLPYVDDANIGILGICAGGGATIKASTTDRRIKSVATVSAVDVGAATRLGWDGKASEADQMPLSTPWPSSARPRPLVPNPSTCPTSQPSVTARHPWTCRRRPTTTSPLAASTPRHPTRCCRSAPATWSAFTGFDRIDTLLTQPLLVVAGSDAGSLWHSEELYSRAASTQKELAIIPGATHMDLYDGPGVDQSMQRLTPFFTNTL